MSGAQGPRGGRGGEMTFTGPATFFKAPYRPWNAVTSLGASGAENGDEPGCDVGFLGVPYDFAVGYRPGARFAPAAVREASGRFALPPEGFYDFASDSRRLAGATLLDAGDVDPVQLDHAASCERVTRAARGLRSRVRLPVFVGGDHSVSLPLLRAYADVPTLEVVQLDAHLDFSDQRNGTRFSNSSPFRRAAEELPRLAKITTIGLRGMRGDQEAFAAARARGHELVSAAEVHANPAAVALRLPAGAAVYLSLDVDVLDPAELPGTSSPEPGGLSFAQIVTLIVAVCQRNRLVGVDLTELSPGLDPSGRSALLGARLLAEVAAAWWDSA